MPPVILDACSAHVSGLYRVVPDSECTLTADDFPYELSAGLSAEELRTKIKELVLHHDHRRLKDLPYLYKKFKGDEARLHLLLQQLLVEGRTEAEAELATVVSDEVAAIAGAQDLSGPLLSTHRPDSAGRTERLPTDWTKVVASESSSDTAGNNKAGGQDLATDVKRTSLVWEVPKEDLKAHFTVSGDERDSLDGEQLPKFAIKKVREGTRKVLRVEVVMPKVNDGAEVEIRVERRLCQVSSLHYKTVRSML